MRWKVTNLRLEAGGLPLLTGVPSDLDVPPSLVVEGVRRAVPGRQVGVEGLELGVLDAGLGPEAVPLEPEVADVVGGVAGAVFHRDQPEKDEEREESLAILGVFFVISLTLIKRFFF